jgi:hypothetical protein
MTPIPLTSKETKILRVLADAKYPLTQGDTGLECGWGRGSPQGGALAASKPVETLAKMKLVAQVGVHPRTFKITEEGRVQIGNVSVEF